MSTRTPHILDAFQRGYLAYFGPPTHIICDQDPAFTSSLMEAFVTQLNIKIVLVSPTNHQSLQAEHGIKSLSGLLPWEQLILGSTWLQCDTPSISLRFMSSLTMSMFMNSLSSISHTNYNGSHQQYENSLHTDTLCSLALNQIIYLMG